MMNPCFSTEVAIEVTNDGENYSGGEGLNGTFILSTAKYNDPLTRIYRSNKNFNVKSTFGVYLM